jgi:hypothetical protein
MMRDVYCRARLRDGMPVRHLPRAFSLRAAALCLCVVLAPATACAEFSIEGDVSALRVEADQTPIEEIFTAITAIYGVAINAEKLPEQPVTGVYAGSLQRVIASMLDRYDYVLSVTPETIEISYLNARGQGGVRVAERTGKPARRQGITRVERR